MGIKIRIEATEDARQGEPVKVRVDCPECYFDSEQELVVQDGLAVGDCYCKACGWAWDDAYDAVWS